MNDQFFQIGSLKTYFKHNPEGHMYLEYDETTFQDLPTATQFSHISSILQDLNYGSTIYDVEILPNAILCQSKDEHHWKSNQLVLRNPRKLDLDEIKNLISKGADPNIRCELPLIISASLNKPKWVKFFHSECEADLHARNNLIVQTAHHYKAQQVLEYLIFNGGDLGDLV